MEATKKVKAATAKILLNSILENPPQERPVPFSWEHNKAQGAHYVVAICPEKLDPILYFEGTMIPEFLE